MGKNPGLQAAKSMETLNNFSSQLLRGWVVTRDDRIKGKAKKLHGWSQLSNVKWCCCLCAGRSGMDKQAYWMVFLFIIMLCVRALEWAAPSGQAGHYVYMAVF
jgi:hypothetical protein